MNSTLIPVSLRCEYKTNPLGIDAPVPRLFWTLDAQGRRDARQTAYQIVADDGALWDSGKVASSQSVHIPYGGPALCSGQRVGWKVRVWDENDQDVGLERCGVLADGPAVARRLGRAVDQSACRAAAFGPAAMRLFFAGSSRCLNPSPAPRCVPRRGVFIRFR